MQWLPCLLKAIIFLEFNIRKVSETFTVKFWTEELTLWISSKYLVHSSVMYVTMYMYTNFSPNLLAVLSKQTWYAPTIKRKIEQMYWHFNWFFQVRPGSKLDSMQ